MEKGQFEKWETCDLKGCEQQAAYTQGPCRFCVFHATMLAKDGELKDL